MKRASVTGAGFALILSGCSPKTIALRATASLMETGQTAYHDESDALLAKESMGATLKLLDALLVNEPDNPRLLLLASQGYGGYAFLFLEDLSPERAKTFYLRGRDYGLRLLSRNKALAGARAMSPADLEEALKRAAPSDVPALFWAAYGWSGWINLSRDSAEAIADLPKAFSLMARAHELSPRYYFAGADLFFGAYYASRPKLLGGDPEKSKAHFDWARRINEGKFLMGNVLQARYYAVAVQDEELFKKLLTLVKEAPAGALPGSRLVDEVAKLKAAALLEKANDYF